MYLDAMFSITSKGIDSMKMLAIHRRLDYVLGVDEDDSFTEHMINIVDFCGTIPLFYDLLVSPEVDLLELDKQSMEEMYKDEYFIIFHFNALKVKNLAIKLQEIDLEYLKTTMLIAEGICGEVIYKGYDKFKELKSLVEEANLKDAHLLIVMRFQ